MCQCRFVSCDKHTPIVKASIMGQTAHFYWQSTCKFCHFYIDSPLIEIFSEVYSQNYEKSACPQSVGT